MDRQTTNRHAGRNTSPTYRGGGAKYRLEVADEQVAKLERDYPSQCDFRATSVAVTIRGGLVSIGIGPTVALTVCDEMHRVDGLVQEQRYHARQYHNAYPPLGGW